MNCLTDDSKLLLTASGDQTVILWEVETGIFLYKWKHSGSVRCVRFCEGQYSRFLTVVDPFSTYPASLNVYSLAASPEDRA